MEWIDLVVLGAAAFLTSALTAVAGLGGGIILLAVLLLYLEPVTAIPVHGAIQLVSNGSRTWIQRSFVAWPLVARFSVLLLPAGLLGLGVVTSLPASPLRATIGVFALLATWWPRGLLLGVQPGTTDPERRFIVLGGVVGFLNVTIGAPGPFLGPFFRDLGLPRQGVVGSFAACQSLGHAVKIALFAGAGFVFREYALLMAVGVVGVVAGTALGSRLLDRVSEGVFQWLYRIAITLIAIRLVVAEALVRS